MFTGSTIPSKWQLCDGATGSYIYENGQPLVIPDLQNKFVLGAGSTYPSGSTGGSSTIQVSNLPSHTHTGITTNGTGGHVHTIPIANYTQLDSQLPPNYYVIQQQALFYTAVWDDVPSYSGFTTLTEGVDTVPTAQQGEVHQHEFTTDGTGGGAEYFPPYYVLTYIIKVSM
jgi:microcystin-dependent protein